jgi:DUF4097 and DUF4098 domain-containing protein YvlB
MHRLSVCSCAAVCLVAMAVIPVWSGTDDTGTYKFDVASGQAIKFDLESGGSVTVVGWDQPGAEVSYVQSGKGNKHEVEVVERGGDIVVTSGAMPSEGQSRNLEFRIKLPRRFSVSFESAGGNLTISGLDGDFEGTTMGGGLVLTDVNGKVQLKTMGGHIQVTDATLDGNLTTMGGTVYLKDVVGDVDAKSMGGNVKYENVRGRDGKLRAPGGISGSDIEKETVTISTMGGSIELDDAPAGALVSTMGGDIALNNASGFVRAKTMGGNIGLHVTDGWVDATTMAGNIGVEITGGLGDGEEGVSLASCCGDVELVVPADLSMDLDLTVKYTKNSSQDFEIKSDFPVQTERSQDWDYSNGSPRKRIHATGKIAGGRYPVVIETINGDIRVLKAK